MTPSLRGRGRTASLALLAAVVAAALGFGAVYPPPPLPHAPAPADPSRQPRFSMLAVGDTGQRHWLPSLREGQLAVARELTAADLARPADTLVLLGDNFYPSGLSAGELVPRIRLNLVWPYCRFAALDGPRSEAVADACTLPPALRRSVPPPIHAVLGNHDHKDPDSPALQAQAVPQFVPNWHVHAGLVDVVDFEPGVSLILLDSTTLTREEQVGSVRDALRRARGPWRILVAHHPIARLAPASGSRPSPSAELLRRAIAEAGVSVHLFLSGHDHNLQGIEMETPSRLLHLIAGGGAGARRFEREYANRVFALKSTGFARVDIALRDGREELNAELWATPRVPAVFWRGARRVARWTVSSSGAHARELP